MKTAITRRHLTAVRGAVPTGFSADGNRRRACFYAGSRRKTRGRMTPSRDATLRRREPWSRGKPTCPVGKRVGERGPRGDDYARFFRRVRNASGSPESDRGHCPKSSVCRFFLFFCDDIRFSLVQRARFVVQRERERAQGAVSSD